MEKKRKVALLSVVSNTVLIILKIITGIITGSISIISEAIHSSLDLIASVIAYFAVKKSSIPPDKDHPYGHSKIENIAGFIESVLIIIAGLWIIYESIKKLIFPKPIEVIWAGISVMLVSAIVNIYVSRKLYFIAQKTNSIALKSDAAHLTTDVYTSSSIMFGLLLIWILERIFPNKYFHWIDPLLAIITAGIIIKIGYKILSESLKDLLDGSATEAEIAKIDEIIKNSEGIIGYRNLKTRKSGGKIFIELELMIDKNLSFEKAHKITENVMKNIKDEINSEIIIHSEPCETQQKKD